MLIIAVAYGGLTTRFPVSGGEFAFSYVGFGKYVSFIASWFLALGYICVVALNASAFSLLFKFIGIWTSIILIVAIAPWMYVGFDNIPQAAEEFKFSPDKTFKLIVFGIIASIITYVLMILITSWNKTPYVSVLFIMTVCLAAPWLGRTALSWIVDMSSTGVSVAFLITSLVAVKFFSKKENYKHPLLDDDFYVDQCEKQMK